VHLVDDTVTVSGVGSSALAEQYFSTEQALPSRSASARELEGRASFVDGIRYDLDIECAGGNTEIKMIFNSATGEELDANINGKFSISEDGKRWLGTLTIEPAYYRYIKTFDADGTLKFSGNFLNPEMNITARYSDVRVIADSISGDRSERVVVLMTISGTRKAPKLEWSMTIDGTDYYAYNGPKSADVQSDALAFILAGNFPLTRSEANDLAADLGPTARSSLLTGAGSLFTKAISDFLKEKTGFINSLELSYGTQSSVGDATDIRIAGSVGDGLWKYGGRILNDPFSNANLSIMYSLGDIFEKPSLRNFMVELERKVEINQIGETNERKQTNSARLFYRFSF
jgi:hypothetical protein